MTRDEVVAQIKVMLGFRTDQTNTIVTQIGIEQRRLEREEKWLKMPGFLETEISDAILVANGERLAKPSDWLRDIENNGLYVYDEDGCEHELVKNEEDTLRAYYREYDPTLPASYCSDFYYYRLFPKPDQAYTVKMRYYQSAPIVSEGEDTNVWLTYAPNLIIGRVGLFLCGAGNNTRRDMFGAMANASKAALEENAFNLDTDNRQYAMGENF